MTEHSNPAAHNQTKNLPSGPVSDYLDRVVNSLQLADMSPEDRQRVLSDHIAGSMLRTLGTQEGYETLCTITSVAGRGVVDPDTGLPLHWARAITRRGGVRQVMADIDNKAEDRGVFVTLTHGFHIENDDPATLTMTRMDQIAAYLDTKTPEEAQLPPIEAATAWQETIKDEITKYLQIDSRKEAWRAAENLGSDVAGVRRDQQKWQDAIATARKAGLDIDLITRSAEDMKRSQQAGQKVGRVALLTLAPDFRHLFRD